MIKWLFNLFFERNNDEKDLLIKLDSYLVDQLSRVDKDWEHFNKTLDMIKNR